MAKSLGEKLFFPHCGKGCGKHVNELGKKRNFIHKKTMNVEKILLNGPVNQSKISLHAKASSATRSRQSDFFLRENMAAAGWRCPRIPIGVSASGWGSGDGRSGWCAACRERIDRSSVGASSRWRGGPLAEGVGSFREFNSRREAAAGSPGLRPEWTSAPQTGRTASGSIWIAGCRVHALWVRPSMRFWVSAAPWMGGSGSPELFRKRLGTPIRT